MKILHTSDWHLGRRLFGRQRYEEFEAFLDWLAVLIEDAGVDVLVVAGDVFDTSTPSNRAQSLYYRFLCRLAGSCCRHVVVVAGNHDSPTFLDAPRELLKVLDVHVIGAVPDDLADEVLVLHHPETGMAELVVCAVPYLRDRDIRRVEAGESVEDKDRKLIEGIRDHYRTVVELACRRRAELDGHPPMLATGHLFTAGGRTMDGDGVRDLYVGSLAHVGRDIFPDGLDYVALGHLHVAQTVQGSERVRYSGSPLPMGFGEAGQRKSVCLVELEAGGSLLTVRCPEVPVFQPLARVRGDWEAIQARLRELVAADSRAWLEVIYEGEAVIGDLRARLDEILAGSRLEVLRLKNARVIDRVLAQCHDRETLDDLDVHDVFERCLTRHEVPDTQRPSLRLAYRETVAALHDADPLAE
ncbi:exonuclease SbcCD subunit D C-terminal domain-containing protein [Ectothiorhodospira shaposhnikovii]|uniref:exonuclease SbcCD subunit D C-terminal domain-containing protein n=1 Tax=Ectothiorhodospira shaposhnikovii TaxID=1054 RepID=UPI001EE78D37|nr:exonuclease SbcCD subunit D C-terminal domain-containing protein [Ectothiorhodospira shaposhnikovii]MCG5512460.1 exonuclease SbcCD subunit D C-terminal domain-containing protein [Ectothiorhodospira shaposhnikovii]